MSQLKAKIKEMEEVISHLVEIKNQTKSS